MPHFQLTSCRMKIQLCVGYFPDGRMRTRTFGIKNVRPDVSADDLAAVARAIGALLAHPVVRIRLVRKYLLVPDTPSAGESPLRQEKTLTEPSPPFLRRTFAAKTINCYNTLARDRTVLEVALKHG